MKQTTIIIFIFLGIFFSGCSDDSGPVIEEPCVLTMENNIFSTIDQSTEYNTIENLLGSPSATSSFGNSSTNTWNFCDNNDLYITIIFTDSKIVNKVKSFSDESCSQNLNLTNYELIVLEQTVAEVRAILQDDGDTFAVNYKRDPTLTITETITWYDCTDTNKRIQAIFKDGLLTSKEKSF